MINSTGQIDVARWLLHVSPPPNSGGAQGAERHRTVTPSDTRMSLPWVKAPPLKKSSLPKGCFCQRVLSVSRVLFPFLPPLLVTPLPPLFSAPFSPFSPLKKERLSSVEQWGQHRAWKGAVSGWTSPQISERKFLPEIRVKKGQGAFNTFFFLGVCMAAMA